jgi:phospholipase A1
MNWRGPTPFQVMKPAILSGVMRIWWSIRIIFDWTDSLNPILQDTLKSNQLFRLQFSTKFQALSDYKSGLFLGYSQVMFWNLMGESSPISEVNYVPEVFFRFRSQDNFAGDVYLGLLDYVQFGLRHTSNGLASGESRSHNQLYGMLQFVVGTDWKFELNAMAYIFMQDLMPGFFGDNTENIKEYRSNWRFATNLYLPFREVIFLPQSIKLEFAPGGGARGWDFFRGYAEMEVRFGNIIQGVSPFLQAFIGYGESLIEYEEFGTSLRIGFSLE